MSQRKLRSSLKKFSNKKEERLVTIAGELGLPLNGKKLVEVPNRRGYVFVRLHNNTSEVIQAYNSEVSTIYGLPVLVARSNNIYRVVGRDQERYRDWGNIPYLPKHGGQHSFNPAFGMGADIVWVYGQQFMPLLGYPSGTDGGTSITIAPYTLKDANGNFKFVGNTGTQNISQYRPSSGSIMVLVYVDSVSGNPYLLVGSGTVFSSTLTGTNDVTPYIPQITNPAWIPTTAVRLTTGTNQLFWGNLYDVRPFIDSNNNSLIYFQDDGVPKGYAGTIEAGDNLTVSISGSVARLDVSGISENIYFLTSGSSGVSTYDLMTLGRPTGTYNFYSASISATGTLLADWITEPNVPSADFISDGVYHLHVHAQKTAGTKDARFRYIFSERTTLGAETVLHVSNLSAIIPSSETEMDVESFEPEHSLTSTDRLVVRLYAFPEGAGTAPTIQIKVEGDTLSRFEIPAISSTSGQMSIAIQDEGVAQGTATTLNFVGNNVDATVAGGVARIFITGSTGGGINTGTLDARYLLLDTSNDPLTGQLRIIPSSAGTEGLNIATMNDTPSFSVTQRATGSAGVVSSAFNLTREVSGNGAASFSEPLLYMSQSRGASGTITGGLLRYDADSTTRVVINPSVQGTGTLVSFDGDFTLSSNGLLLLLKNHGTSRFYVNASGTAHSNGEPLIKEAITNSGTYGRKDAGWEEVIPRNGWSFVNESWIRTGNHTFIMSGDLTVYYRKGTKIKYNDGGLDYGVIGSSSFASGTTTTVNLIPNSDYAMASSPNARYLSYIENPEGFPDWFNYSATIGGFSGTPTQISKFTVKGKLILMYTFITGTSNSTSFTTTLPIAQALSIALYFGGFRAMDNSIVITTSVPACVVNGSSATVTFYKDWAATGWTAAGTKEAAISIPFEF